MEKYEVYIGKETWEIDFPEAWDITYVPMAGVEAIEDPAAQLKRKLEGPMGCQRLSQMLKAGRKVAICVTDISRPTPDHILLPPVLQELHSAGIAPDDITILIALGAHRPMTTEEMYAKYGEQIVRNYRVINHNARDRSNLTDLGTTKEGVPRVVNSLLTSVDGIISIGVTDLHQYAGFSGGAKTIAVGCAAEETISYTHSASFLERSGAVPGNVDNNLFQEALWEIVEPLPFLFCVNIILDEKKDVLKLDAGDPPQVHKKVMEDAKRIFIFETDKPFDTAYFGVPHPKDVNLYQATRAATYQVLSDRPVIREGGIINLLCTCPEEFGEGDGEERFKQKMISMPSAQAVLDDMSGKENLPGEQRAFMAAKTMVRNPINVFGSHIDKETLINAKFLCQDLIPQDLLKKPIRAVVMKDGQKKIMRMKS